MVFAFLYVSKLGIVLVMGKGTSYGQERVGFLNGRHSFFYLILLDLIVSRALSEHLWVLVHEKKKPFSTPELFPLQT